MISLFEVLLSTATLVTLLPVVALFTEVLLAMTTRSRRSIESGERRRVAIVMPAHDEASTIARALHSILPQLQPSDRLLVVADNCGDDTAEIVISQGAEAIVRTDPLRRGKGYALEFGIHHLALDPPEVVIIIDADCSVADGTIDRIARLCVRTMRPVQSLYLMKSPPNAGAMTRIAEFAWVVKNLARPLGLLRLGLPCQLMGTGMAFPWGRLESAPLASGHIVEDLKLGIDLAHAGAAPLFCPEALVTSTFPTSAEGIRSQRTRWEHGHLAVILGEAPRLLMRSFTTLNIDLLAMALDLSVPPLALLTLLVIALCVASGVFFLLTTIPFPLIITTASAAMLLTAVLLSWVRYGRGIISLGGLAHAVLYAFWKIPLYGKFLIARQLDWVRSKRDEDE